MMKTKHKTWNALRPDVLRRGQEVTAKACPRCSGGVVATLKSDSESGPIRHLCCAECDGAGLVYRDAEPRSDAHMRLAECVGALMAFGQTLGMNDNEKFRGVIDRANEELGRGML